MSSTDEIVTSLILTADGLSIVSTAVILLTILLDSPARNKSYNLKLIFRLLLSDFCMSLIILIFYCMESAKGPINLSTACSISLPILMFFLVSGFSWTVMIAVRFAYSNQKRIYKPKIPLWGVWLLTFFLLVPTIIMNANGNKVLSAEEDDTVLACTYNHTYRPAIIVDIITVQVPIVISLTLNLLAYAKGYRALKDAPHSVLARYMRRVGGYLMVLIIVWVPVFSYNILSISLKSNHKLTPVLNAVVFLLCSQGFLNVCVYIWSNSMMKKWLFEAFCIYKLLKCCKVEPDLEDPSKTVPDENDIDDDDEMVGDINTSSTQENPVLTENSNNFYNDSFTNTFQGKNPRNSFQKYQARKRADDDNQSVPNVNEGRTKLSMISKKINPSVTVEDLDSEKYVRFGGVTTKLFSTSFSSFISSVRSSISGSIEDTVSSDPSIVTSPIAALDESIYAENL